MWHDADEVKARYEERTKWWADLALNHDCVVQFKPPAWMDGSKLTGLTDFVSFFLILSVCHHAKNCNIADDDESWGCWCAANSVINVAYRSNMLVIIGHTVWARKGLHPITNLLSAPGLTSLHEHTHTRIHTPSYSYILSQTHTQ